MKKGLNVMSFFDGCSCLQLALKETNIKVNKYFAAEVDKYTIKVTQANFPNTKQIGDVVKVRKVYAWKVSTLNKLFDSNYISEKTKKEFQKLLFIRKEK